MTNAALGSEPFRVDAAEIAKVRSAFDAAGFDEESVARACGVRAVRDLRAVAPEQVLRATDDGRPLSTLVRLFVLGVPCEAAAVRTATGPLPVDRWIAGGLLRTRSGALRGAVKMIHCDGLLMAFDVTHDDGEAEDHVMGPSESATILSKLTIRRPCTDALDIGAGCGFMALLAASHASRVVATDINPRAAAFASFNAQLNGLANVESLVGDRLAPVAGREFDLVVSNPPFMISPEDRIRYLSGGMKADEFCRRLAAEVPAVLRDGGIFQMKCSWIEREVADWQSGLQAWFDGTGCDTWVLRSSSVDPVEYARSWMRLGAGGEAEDPSRLATWLDYYASERVSKIGGGVVVMRKRRGENWFRGLDGPPRITRPCGDEVRARIDVLDFLARTTADAALMGSVLAVPDNVRLHQECGATAGGWAQIRAELRVDAGLAYTEEVDLYVGELVAWCDGERTLGAAVAQVAERLGWSAEDVPAETADIVRQLLEEGFLAPVSRR